MDATDFRSDDDFDRGVAASLLRLLGDKGAGYRLVVVTTDVVNAARFRD